MASTIRHNRARGSHDVDLMSNIVKELHELGRSDAWISRHLGMDKDEILRLKQITGLAALFEDVQFGAAWQPAEETADGMERVAVALEGEGESGEEEFEEENSRIGEEGFGEGDGGFGKEDGGERAGSLMTGKGADGRSEG